MATLAMQTNDEENTPIEVKAASATGKGTHTRFCDDNEAAEKVLADISNKEKEASAAAKEALAEPKEEEAAEDQDGKKQEESEEEAEGDQDGEEGEGVDPKLAYRSVPSHFYPEAKTRDTKFCGTHKRFEDEDNVEAKPLSEAEQAAMDALATNVDGAMVLDPKEPAK